MGHSILELAQGLSSVFKIGFGSNSLDEANKLLNPPLVDPSSDYVNNWMTLNGRQGLVLLVRHDLFVHHVRM